MWEKLFEFSLFLLTCNHRKPALILKEFIGSKNPTAKTSRITKSNFKHLKVVFNYIDKAYKSTSLAKTKWAKDNTHFYIMVTSLIGRVKSNPLLPDDITTKLIDFDKIMSGKSVPTASKDLIEDIGKYSTLSQKQTTDANRRNDRMILFDKIINAI